VKQFGILLAATTALVALSADAWAQQRAVTDGIEEITVTARQRSENLRDVPDSVRAFTAREIKDAGIVSIRKLSDLVPNLSVVDSQDSSLVAINIRGIGQVRNGEPPVAINIDGVLLSSPDQIKQPLYDIQQIEILKGPQGALYGRNAIGGAINIRTKQPSNELETTLEAGYANGNDRTLSFVSTGALVQDKVFFRLAGDFRAFDGVIPNETLHRKVDFAVDRNIRARFLVQASDALSFDIRAAYGKLRAGASYYIPLPDGQPNNTTIPVQADELGVSQRRLSDFALKADYKLAAGTITSTTAVNTITTRLREDLDWTPQPVLLVDHGRNASSISEDFRFTSNSDQPLRYMAGVYYLRTRPGVFTNLFLGPAKTGPVPLADTKDVNNAYAAFGQVNYDLLSNLELTLALRYDREDRRQTDLLANATQRSTSFDAFQPKVSLAWKFVPGSLAYLTYAEGFRSGGFNAPTPFFPLIFKAEQTRNIEVGFKTEQFERKLALDAAFFHTDFDNQQIFDFVQGIQGLTNIKKTELYGVDASATYRPLPGLEFSAGLGWTHSRIADFNGTSLYVGNHTPLAYTWSYNLAAQYTRPVGEVLLTGRVDYSRKSGLYWHIDNADKQAPVPLVNLHLTASYQNWEFGLFADNLFDHRYTEEFFAREFLGASNDIRWPGTPRRFGMTARVSF
jgi:iron complex outermembrane recepter protein